MRLLLKTLPFLAIFILLISVASAVSLDYTTATPSVICDSCNLQQGLLSNINDGDLVRDADGYAFYNSVTDGDKWRLTFNDSYAINRVGANFDDGSGSDYPFDLTWAVNGTQVHQYSYDGTSMNVSQNVSISVTNGNYLDLIIGNFTSNEQPLIVELFAYGETYSPTASNFTVTVTDYWDNSTVNNAWAYIGTSNYTTTNGTIITDLLDNSTSLYNITVGGDDHFNRQYLNVNISSNLEADLYGSDIKFRAFEAVTGDEISANFTVNTTTNISNASFYLTPGITYNVTANSTGYYGKVQSFNVSGRDNNTYNVTGLYDSIVNVTAINAWGGTSISNFSLFVNSTYGTLINSSTSNGYLSFGAIQGINYTFFVNVTGDFVPTNATYNVNTSAYDVEILMYPYNSLNITFRDELTNNLLSGINVTAEFVSDSYSVNYTTTTGKLNITLSYPDEYTIYYDAPNYSPRTYTFTMTNGTHLDITLYLVSGAEDVEISVYDTLNNALVGALVSVLKFDVPTNTYNLVEIATTNFEGVTDTDLFLDTQLYKFIVVYNGETVLTTPPSIIYDTTMTLYANLIGEPFNELFVLTGFYGVISQSTETTFTYDFADKDALATQGCMYAYRVSFNTETLVNSSCSAGASGSVVLGVDNSTGYSYVFKGYITKDGENYYITNFYHKYGDGFTEDGNGILLVIVLILVFALIGFWRLEAAVIFAGLSLLLVSITGLVALPVAYTVGVFVLSLVAAYLISRRSA